MNGDDTIAEKGDTRAAGPEKGDPRAAGPEKGDAPAAFPEAAATRWPEQPSRGLAGRAPDVIVDFEVERGLLDVVVRNIGDGPAHRVRVSFDPVFRGVDGCDMTALALFHRLDFLAPGRTLRACVDSIAAYTARGEPDVITATAMFYDDGGRGYRRRVRHDLGIYRDLPQSGSRG